MLPIWSEDGLRIMMNDPEGVSFKLPRLSKTSHPGQDPKLIFHASFPDDQDLCPVACLKEYETRTKDFRSGDLSKPNNLFLSYIHPHKPVTSATLAGWIKVSFRETGIDMSIFTAHSVRAASTSAKANNENGRQAQENTFVKY